MRALADKFFAASQSPAVRQLERIVAEIAPTEIPVLITGESGTGKEVMALQIHRRSARQREPFQKLICSNLAAAVFDELRQAKNGDDASIQGFSSAGTVFLDEISELDAACQPKLLHALPNGDVLPDDRRLRGRIISSSGRNLEDEIRTGRFREDLYYRLNDVCLRLIPLRHRKDDIPELVDFFLTKYSAQFARQKPSLSAEALDKLLDYSWPGNIRQLENAVKLIVALGDERLALADLGALTSESSRQSGRDEKISLKQAAKAASRQAERELILRTIERTHWNRKRAAKELQISYKALLYKLKQIGLDDPEGAVDPPGDNQ